MMCIASLVTPQFAVGEGPSANQLCFSIPGMHCNGCVDKISEEVEAVAGVKSVLVDLKSKSATVTFTKETSKPELIVKAISNAGYEASAQACSGGGASKDQSHSKTGGKKNS